jgi:hypothetical protein
MPSVRRRLPWIRIGLGACVALSALGIALTHRWAPEAVQMVSQQPAPISEVVQCVECAAFRQIVPPKSQMLSLRESDATQFLGAMATLTSISENEGRRSPTPSASPTAIVSATPLVMPTQVVSAEIPGASFPSRAHPMSTVSRIDASLFPSESILSSASVRTAVFSAEAPRVKIVPSFLDHDLDGMILPR